MSAQEHFPPQPQPAHAAARQNRRHLVTTPGDRIVRQIEAIDAWNVARRKRESLLEAAGGSRVDWMADRRQADVLRRTHQAIVSSAHGQLAEEVGPLLFPGATAVIAHRHSWFAEKLAGLIAARGVTVLACTDNGAEALGVVVAEQPDVLLAGDRLGMLPGDVLLAETELFSPATFRAVQISEPRQEQSWLAQADAVFLRHHPPAEIEQVLSAFCLDAPTQMRPMTGASRV